MNRKFGFRRVTRCALDSVVEAIPPNNVRRVTISDSMVLPRLRWTRCALVLAMFDCFGFAAIDMPVPTESGLVAGAGTDVKSFKGIPYAAPPVGDLRWRPPERAARWQGIRETARFGPVCMQDASVLRDPSAPMSEDCLTLNIWTAARSANDRLPVMVWIHGGGFRRGSSSQPQYDGEHLARRGVVVVSFNYRLGIFGFLAHPLLSRESRNRVSGNYGVLDQIAALGWVQRNIGAFGGDPKRVTIFGESAGAFSVLLLNVSPLAAGLYERAISESGGLRIPHLREAWHGEPSAESIGEKIAANPVALRSRSAQQVLDLSIHRQPNDPSIFLGLVYRPVVDGYVFPQDPVMAYRKGRQHCATLLAGTNADEGSLFTSALRVNSIAEFGNYLQIQFGTPERIVDHLVETLSSNRADGLKGLLARFIADEMFYWPTREALRGVANGGGKAFRYQFTRVNGEGRRGSGAFHGSEVPYVFGTMSVAPLGFGPLRPGTYDYGDVLLSNAMQNAWVSFARTGDPSGGGIQSWPLYDSVRGCYEELGSELRTGCGLRDEELDLVSAAVPQP